MLREKKKIEFDKAARILVNDINTTNISYELKKRHYKLLGATKTGTLDDFM
jgi:hypothetical protein